jgi:allophanate hydrolase subunit 2
MFTTVQDLGRPGYRRFGVPTGGAADREALERANALVGNRPGTAAIELTAWGGAYEARRPLRLALAGAPFRATIVRPDGRSSPVRANSAFRLEPREILEIGPTDDGLRGYLAVRGGWRTKAVLGSQSSEIRLEAGAVLETEGEESGDALTRWLAPSAASSEPIRFVDGPDAEPLRAVVDLFASGRPIVVRPDSNRMGLRLEKTDDERARFRAEIAAGRASTPVLPGALQDAGAEWIVLGVAGGTMGGYPHFGQVLDADLDRLGQVRPGAAVTFARVSIDEARRAARERRERLRREGARIALMSGFSPRD